MDSLRDLATLAARVADEVESIEKVATAEHFSKLQDELNELQVVAPCCSAVVAARLRWYMHGLENFIRCFVEAVEQKKSGWERWAHHSPGHQLYPVPGLIMGTKQVVDFLTRGYLGEAFADIYPRVEALFDRIVEATEGTIRQKLWVERRENLRRAMLEGRI